MDKEEEYLIVQYKVSRGDLEEEIAVKFSENQWSKITKTANHAELGHCNDIHSWFIDYIKTEVLKEKEDICYPMIASLSLAW